MATDENLDVAPTGCVKPTWRVLPYASLCEFAGNLHQACRHQEFTTIGRVPIDTPSRPARLDLVRQFAASVDHRAGKIDDRYAATAAAEGAAKPSDDKQQRPGIGEENDTDDAVNQVRTFVKHCNDVIVYQEIVEAFDAHKIYFSCNFFCQCSRSFIKALVARGGPCVWKGFTVDAGVEVYSAGKLGSSMFIIARGVAEAFAVPSVGKLVTVSGAGTEAEPKVLTRGDCVGQPQGLGVDNSRWETVRAKTALHLLEVSCSLLTRLLQQPTKDGEDSDPGIYEGEDGGEYGDVFDSAPIPETAFSSGAAQRAQYAFADERKYFEKQASLYYAKLNPPKIRRRMMGRPKNQAFVSEKRRTGAELWRRIAGTPSRTSIASHTSSARRTCALTRQSLLTVSATESCEGQEDVLRREKMLQKLREDMRGDIKRGYMIPADAVTGPTPKKAPDSTMQAKAASSKHGFVQVLAKLRHTRNQDDIAHSEDDENVSVNIDSPFDIDLLPPLKYVSPRQKQLLMKDLEKYARASKIKRKVSVMRQRVATILDSHRKWETLNSRQSQICMDGHLSDATVPAADS